MVLSKPLNVNLIFLSIDRLFLLTRSLVAMRQQGWEIACRSDGRRGSKVNGASIEEGRP
jgi:hypothetical protein